MFSDLDCFLDIFRPSLESIASKDPEWSHLMRFSGISKSFPSSSFVSKLTSLSGDFKLSWCSLSRLILFADCDALWFLQALNSTEFVRLGRQGRLSDEPTLFWRVSPFKWHLAYFFATDLVLEGVAFASIEDCFGCSGLFWTRIGFLSLADTELDGGTEVAWLQVIVVVVWSGRGLNTN